MKKHQKDCRILVTLEEHKEILENLKNQPAAPDNSIFDILWIAISYRITAALDKPFLTSIMSAIGSSRRLLKMKSTTVKMETLSMQVKSSMEWDC